MKKGLFIGINNYPNAPLKGCVGDATELSTILKVNGDGSPNFDVKLKTDLKTKSEVKQLIVDLFSGNPDIALFYFSGHGAINQYGGYVVTPDAKLYDDGVSMDEILAVANKSKAANKVIILDCCFSGNFGDPKIIENNGALLAEGMTIFTASKKDETAEEVNNHGVFTSLLMMALQGGAADITGNITPGGVYAYIDKALGAWQQRPVFKTHTTRFISLRNIPPQVPISTLRLLSKYFSTPTSEFALNPTFEYTQPTAKPENVVILKNLQKLESVGLVVPVGEEHIYWAAMNSKSCKLTAIGHHYWRLAKSGKL